MKTKMVSIVGLDKETASIGMALRESDLGLSVLGHAREKKEAQEARDIGAVDETTGNLVKAAQSADILIIKTPYSDHAVTLEVIGDEVQDHTLIVDMSKLKGASLMLADKYIRQGHYIGANPVLAAAWLSDGQLGIEAAHADLFEHSIFCLMPSVKADPKAVETAVNLGRILGATPYFLDPHEYDSLMQGVETLPALLGAAMFRAVSQATGWRDLLRFAGLDFALATSSIENRDIAPVALNDKEATLRWLDAALAELQVMRRLVADGDQERLSLVLEDVEKDRYRWLDERARNAWTDDTSSPDVGSVNIGAQLFGFRRGSSKKDSK
ncbi:MAG: prephenate dehydrogenase/arogenate dehydrogenase family protein [Candidatus Promineifilaceae bacterium]